MSAASAGPQCLECWEEFDIESSPAVDRCERCAEELACLYGTGLLINGQPRFGKGAVLVAPLDLIVGAPAGREQKER